MILTVAGEDVSEFGIYSVDMSTGRDDVYGQPDSTSFQVEFINFQAAGNVGDEVILSDEIGQIFRGWVTDVTAELQEDMSWRTTINATGPLALFGQVFAGISFYPIESDSKRIRRIADETVMASLVGVATTVEGFDMSERQEATNPASAAELARMVADSAMGVLWEQPNSYDRPIRYTAAKYRTWDSYAQTWSELPETDPWSMYEVIWSDVDSDNIDMETKPTPLDLDPATTFADLTFEQNIDDLVRTVEVQWGPEDAETQQEPVTAGSGQAPSKSYTTILQNQGDAVQYAETMLNRYEFPMWRLSSVKFDLEMLTPERQAEIRKALNVGQPVIINMPHGSPVGDKWQGFLEGWSFDIQGDGEGRSFIVDMNVSDRFMTEPADRWIEVGPSVIWETVPDNVRWIDSADVSAWVGVVK